MSYRWAVIWVRLRMVWAVLRGRSVMYRMKVEDGVTSPLTEGWCVVENLFLSGRGEPE